MKRLLTLAFCLLAALGAWAYADSSKNLTAGKDYSGKADSLETVLVDNFMNKTMKNILENPQVSVLVWTREIGDCIQFKGTAEIMKDTPEHKKMHDMLEAKKPGAYPCKDLVVITVKEIFTCMPGANAGGKIA